MLDQNIHKKRVGSSLFNIVQVLSQQVIYEIAT